MMLNKSADHALRAVLFLSRHGDEGQVSADVVAAAIGVPHNYLAKVLNTLVRSRVLTSSRGPRGGFSLAVKPEKLALGTIVEPFQPLQESRACLLGDRPCNRKDPCAAHLRWRRMEQPVAAFFCETTVAELLRPLSPVSVDVSEAS